METVRGYIDHFIYRNEANGYGVIELQTEEEELICVGSFQGVDQGENVEITGQYVEHAVYGHQLKVEKIRVIEPEDAYAMERYLAGGAVKGIGPALAKRIVKKFGNDTFRIMEEEPERLAEIKGISERMAMDIAGFMENRKELRDAMVFLQRYGITNNLALKIYDTYGMRLYSVIEENPYLLAEEIDGIGFKRADEIAKKAGVRVDSEFRIHCGICYVLGQSALEGHTYLPKEELVRRAKELLEAEEELLEEAKAKVDEEQKNLETLIASKEQEINKYSGDIKNKQQAIAEYEADIAMENDTIKALEAALAEERKRLMEEQGSERIIYDGGMFKWPAPSYTRISSDYGWRLHPTLGVDKFHNGVDMAAPGGSPILAAYDGEVIGAGYNSSMGNYIMINHGGGLITIYMHASALYVSTGEMVARGEKIAAVGTTGRSTGNHLHFGVRLDGEYVSPWNYLSK